MMEGTETVLISVEALPLAIFSNSIFSSNKDCWFKNPKGGKRIPKSVIKAREYNN